VISVFQHQQPRVLQFSDARRVSSQVCAGMESLCASSRKDLSAVSVMLTSTQKTPQNLLRSVGRSRGGGATYVILHVTKAISELEAELALPLATHPRQHKATLRLIREVLYGVTDNAV
jgi:hypothetical protein